MSNVSAQSFPVLAKLLAQNSQWAYDVAQIEPSFFSDTAKKQTPKVLWIGCSDSRVPESVIMACKPGEIFTHRNIANQVHLHDDSVLSVITYAVQEVGVEHIIVSGHTNCGGVNAVYGLSKAPPPATAPLTRWLTPLIELAIKLGLPSQPKETAIPTLLEANVKKQVDNVVACDVVQGAWKTGKKVYVHGWVYQLEDGTAKDLGISQGPPAPTKY